MTIFASTEDFFQTKKYINLSSQGDMRVESMVIRKYYRYLKSDEMLECRVMSLKSLIHLDRSERLRFEC